MAEYHVTTFPDPACRTIVRKRVDAAMFAFRNAVFSAVEGQALRDRKAGWDAMNEVDKVERNPLVKGECCNVGIGDYRVLIERVA